MAKGSNHSLPKAAHSVHVKPQKDKMAGNVGGSAHMSQGGKPNYKKGVKLSGGRGK